MTIPLLQDIKQNKRDFRRLGAGLVFMLLLYSGGSWAAASVFNHYLRVYYCLEPVDILCIGHSMSEMGIDKTLLEKIIHRPVGKYCMNGAGTVERLVMLNHYLEEVKTPPKLLVYDVSARLFSGGLAKESYQLFLPFLNHSKVCTAFLRENLSGSALLFFSLSPLSRYENTRLGAVQRGFAKDWKTRKNTQFDPAVFRKRVAAGNFWHISVEPSAVAAFEEMLRICRERKIKVLLAALPCADILNEAEPVKYRQVMTRLKKYCDENGNVVFFDCNPDFSSRYEFFADPIHLNPQGQKAVCAVLGKIIAKTLER